MKHLSLKQIALHIALMMSSFSISSIQAVELAAPTEMTESGTATSIAMFNQSIESSLTNLINRTNTSYPAVKSALVKLDQTADGTLQALVVSQALNGSGQFNTFYNITPDNQVENNQHYIAKFTAETTILPTDADDSDDADQSSLSQLAAQLNLIQIGYFTASGDIVAAVKLADPLNYQWINPQKQTTQISIADATFNYQTSDRMQTLSSNLQIPRLNLNSREAAVIATDLNIQQNSNQFDANLAYTGSQQLTAASVVIDKLDESWWLKDIVINVQKQLNDQLLLSQKNQITLHGLFDAKATQTRVNFDLAANLNIEKIDINAFKQFKLLANQYAQTPAYDQTLLMAMLTQLLNSSPTLELENSILDIEGQKGFFNIALSAMPVIASQNTLIPNLGLLQQISNMNLQAKMIIPAQWFLTFKIFNDKASLDQAIKQHIEQINALNLDGMLNYDGQNIGLNFEVKNGIVWVNGEAKAPLFNLLSLLIK
ncbi:hypothetical protein RHO15_03115 [Utexia brackfieldae]|uniref:hypothetical protein n=1 Tax=Utexia brackfieldae TaxID=3074108 RepID=UPI00370DBEAA